MGNAQILRAPRLQDVGLVGQRADVDIYSHHDEMNFPHGGDKAQQVIRLNVEDASASAADVIGVTLEGYPVAYTATGTLATDLTGLRAALLADPIANGFIDSIAIIDADADTTDDTLALTMRVAGYAVEVGPLPDADALVTISEATAESFGSRFPFGRATYVTNGLATLTKPAGDLDAVLVGISLYDMNRESNVIGESNTTYSARRDVNVARSGRIVVEGGDDAVFGGLVYVGTTAGAELGKFFTASGSGRTVAPKSVLQWIRPNVVEIKLGL